MSERHTRVTSARISTGRPASAGGLAATAVAHYFVQNIITTPTTLSAMPLSQSTRFAKYWALYATASPLAM